MRWLALWLLLTLVQVAGWAAVRLAFGEPLAVTSETLAHFGLLPPVQILALAVLRLFRAAPESSGSA
jgi:hypothetical protein